MIKIAYNTLEEFKIKYIGKIYKDDKRNMEIIDVFYKYKKNGYPEKYFKYKCHNCGYENGEVATSAFLRGYGCFCCRGRILVKGLNDIKTTNPEYIKYFKNIEDTENYTIHSTRKSIFKCPDCGTEKTMQINSAFLDGYKCRICSDGVSYPNKVFGNILKQINIDFTPEYIPDWDKTKRYDFYLNKINNKNIIFEIHGIQHYEESMFSPKARTLEQEQENDKIKMETAIKNIDKYIVIDARYSNINYIKNSILNSDMNEIFDLSGIDWNKVDSDSQKNIIIDVCNYYKNKTNKLNEISKEFKLSTSTIRSYLKTGASFGWCNYNAEEILKITQTRKYSEEEIKINLDEFFNEFNYVPSSKQYDLEYENNKSKYIPRRSMVKWYDGWNEMLKYFGYERIEETAKKT